MNRKAGKILIVDDDKDVLSAARLLLKGYYENVHQTSNPEDIPGLFRHQKYDLVLLDMNFTGQGNFGEEGFSWLERIKEISPATKIILITAYGDVEMAVKGIKSGAMDFIIKPWTNDKMLAIIANAIESRSISSGQNDKPTDDNVFNGIIGQSEPIKAIFETIKKVSATDANILLLGENGTGKEMFAKAIHHLSKRMDKPFVSIDMGSVAESLFESELFGHVKGSFTDAKENRTGRFEEANEGTLFMDEIGNLSLPMQAKLLQALQSRRITRVGSNKEVTIDIRLISATNRELHVMVKQNVFRQDLLFRINTIEIYLPPLHERKGDIPLLADYFLKMYSGKYNKKIDGISSSGLKRLETYRWPGNVRELQHTFERAVILTENDVLDANDFVLSNNLSQGSLGLEDYNLVGAEKIIILKVIDKHKGNITHAAKELGLTRAALYRRIEKYGL